MNNVFVQFFLWCRKRFGVEVDGASLGFFRIVWGCLMAYEGIRKLPKASGVYSADYFHFKYSLTPFVEPLPELWMVQAEIWIMILSAAMVAIGLKFRFFNTLFALLYTHLFLVDKMYFNNHFYLTSLLAFLLSLTAADRCFSVSALWKKRKGIEVSPHIPYWQLFLLRAQVVVVYFFGGVAKLQGDWLQGEPLRHWMGNKPIELLKPPFSWFPGVLQQDWFIWTLSYGGMIFDFVIGFLLWNRKTFWPAAACTVFFHLSNNALFKIGLFPFIGIGLLALFFQPHWPRPILGRWFGKRRGKGAKEKTLEPARRGDSGKTASAGVTAFVLAYLVFHIVFPFRSFKYGGDPSWSEVGHYFAWRMMLRDKDSYVKFFFNPPEAEKILEETGLAPRMGKTHVMKMVKNPHMILQYVHALDDTFRRFGLEDVEIRVVAITSLNGRPFQLMIEPGVDLAKASYGFFEVPNWIVPLEEDRRPGLYPENAEKRREQIARVFDSDAKPVLVKVQRKKFGKPAEEIVAEIEEKVEKLSPGGRKSGGNGVEVPEEGDETQREDGDEAADKVKETNDE